MTEEDARAWIDARFGGLASNRLSRLVDLVIDENQRQNLISPMTVPQIWTRHLLDSAQLVPLAPLEGTWLDIGTGGGFPGLVVAVLREQPTILAEPRLRRAEFLTRCADELGLTNVEVHCAKVEALALPTAVISARAVASVEKLLHAAAACATTTTRWLLPRGRSADADVQQVRVNWTGMFHVEQSLTDASSSILILDQVARR